MTDQERELHRKKDVVMETVTFSVACRQFFGLLSEQTNIDFLKELKQLSEKDKTDLKTLLESQGFIIK